MKDEESEHTALVWMLPGRRIGGGSESDGDRAILANAAPGDPPHDYPFFCTRVDLARYGYVEREFFIEGLAKRYTRPR